MSEFNPQKYKNEYNKENYQRITFRLRKEEAEEVKEFIKEQTDLSLNAFIKAAIEEKIERIKKEGS